MIKNLTVNTVLRFLEHVSKIFIFLIFSFSVLVAKGQSPRTLPAAYQFPIPINYVRTWVAISPESNSNNVTTITTPDKFRMTTNYIDGLGRPLQTVIKQGSLVTGGSGNDIVSPSEYDSFGREQFKYLPFVANNTGGNASISDGLFKLNPFQQQASFSASQYPGEQYYYAQTNYEPSPLSRVQEGFAAGNSWVGTSGDAVENNRHSLKTKYWLNTATDAVRIWNVTNSGTIGAFGSYGSTTSYGAGALYKNITVDEQGKQLIEFKDKEGKVILKKVQLTVTADVGTGSSYSGWLCTYYIYDDLNNLRCVIQPRGVELISASWALTDVTILAEQCFRYEYDSRNRMIVKKVPGAGQVNLVYDMKDRLVMTQDANLNAQTKWMVTLYDALNRPVQTGLLLSSFNNKTFAQNLGDASNSATYPFSDAATPSVSYWEKLSVMHYDDYIGVPGPLTASLNTIYITNANFITSYNTSTDYAQQITQSSQTKGMVTWSQVKVLGTTSQYISQVDFYDEKGRMIQVQSVNQTGGVDIATTQYDFAGKVLRTHLFHQKAGGTVQNYQLATKNTYDILGRLTRVEKNINNTAYKTISSLEYDALGQLKKKSLGTNPVNSSQPLETLSYDYNIRGWILGENRDFVIDLSTANYFGFDLGYDKNGSLGTYLPQYNGNISGTIWKSKGDNQKRKYDFTYDAVNRLTGAGFNQYVSGTGTAAVFNKSAGVDFSVANLTYDANGNIMSMKQSGLKLNASSPIDQLAYVYQANSNKLARVTDSANDNTSIMGDFKYDPAAKGATDYSYDINGNLILDNNKKISSITYNYLNLPSVITVAGKGSITFTYDASGNKLQKITTENNAFVKGADGENYQTNITTITNYINGFIYESKAYSTGSLASLQYTDVLQFSGDEEGRIRRKTDGTFVYDYFLKDHLGNVRMVLTEEQQIDIYPVCTLETSNLATEQAYYNISTAQIVDKTLVTGLPVYVNHNIIPNNPQNPTFDNANSTKVYKLNKNSQNIGLGITLRVMSGDKLDIYGKSYYFQNNTGGTTANTAVTTLNILAGLLGGSTGGSTNVHGAVTATQLNGISGTTGLINTLLGNQTTASNTNAQIPKAFINYILFDDQFKSIGSGFATVGANSVLTDYGTIPALHNIPVTKNGFVYIYCSNESPVDVFFDNIQVMQTRGPILEETHYYPFGLTMAGISSRAANIIPDKDKTFQGQKFDDDLGINYLGFKYRNHDPQIGRFIEIDPLSNKYLYNSTYAFSENKVTTHVELEGLEADYIFAKTKQEVANEVQGLCDWVDNALSVFNTTTNSTEIISTPVLTKSAGTTVTNTAQPNFGGNMSYIICHNSNEGNPEPYFNFSTIVSAFTKTEIKLQNVTLIEKTSVDSKGVVTDETGAKTNIEFRGLPITVMGSTSTSTSGEKRLTFQASTPTTSTQAVANVQYQTNGQQQSISLGVGGQQKAGKTTTTTTFGFRFAW